MSLWKKYIPNNLEVKLTKISIAKWLTMPYTRKKLIKGKKKKDWTFSASLSVLLLFSSGKSMNKLEHRNCM